VRWILANRSSSRHHPHNKIVGGGFFSGFVSMRVSDAWELLGLGNGAASLDGMRVRIARYRQMAPGEDPEIGCVLIRDPRFSLTTYLKRRRWGSPATSCRARATTLRNLRRDRILATFSSCCLASVEVDLAQPWHRPGPVFGDPRLAPYRLGQQAFKAVVHDAYHGYCAITGTHIPPVLQAAHVRPVTRGGDHRLDNGLLPSLAGYLAVSRVVRRVARSHARACRARGRRPPRRRCRRRPGRAGRPTRRTAHRPGRPWPCWLPCRPGTLAR